MSEEIKSVIIYSRINDESVVFTLIEIVNFLVDQKINVILEKSTNARLGLDLPTLSFNEMTGTADLMIIVGGDGSMISAGRKITDVGIPVLGINRGHLGFLPICHRKTSEERCTAFSRENMSWRKGSFFPLP